MPAPYLNGEGQPAIPSPKPDVWLVAPVWSEILRHVKHIKYMLGGFIVVWAIVSVILPILMNVAAAFVTVHPAT